MQLIIRGAIMLKMKYIAIGSLNPYKNNSKTHPDSQIAQIKSSIREIGFCEPILIDEKNTILSGHARVQALKELEESQVPSICLSNLSETQKKKAVIIFNKVQENGDWNRPNLVLELEAILTKEPDSDLKSLGFSTEELSAVLGGSNDFDFSDDTYSEETSQEYQNVIIQYVLIFDDADQQREWNEHLRRLKEKYPELPTHASRITHFIKDNSEKA